MVPPGTEPSLCCRQPSTVTRTAAVWTTADAFDPGGGWYVTAADPVDELRPRVHQRVATADYGEAPLALRSAESVNRQDL